MPTPKQWVVGIDPGFGMSGAVLREVEQRLPVAWATWTNADSQEWPTMRSMSIAFPLANWLIGEIQDRDICELECCLEYPVYNRNPGTLMVQMSLYGCMQHYLYDYITPHVDRLWLTLVNPKTSKRLLAHDGKADKTAMIKASPWADYKAHGLTQVQAHTLADSYAHSLAAGTQQWPLHKKLQYNVTTNLQYPEDDDE